MMRLSLICSLSPQSGLMEAPTKTNRKLRKERKNRAKKVRLSISSRWHSWSNSQLSSSSAARRSPRPRSHPRRASRGCAPLACLHYRLSPRSHIAYHRLRKSCFATVSYAYARSISSSFSMNIMRMRITRMTVWITICN